MTRAAMSSLTTLLENFTEDEILDTVMILCGGQSAGMHVTSIKHMIRRLRRTLDIEEPYKEAEAEAVSIEEVESDEDA